MFFIGIGILLASGILGMLLDNYTNVQFKGWYWFIGVMAGYTAGYFFF